MRLLAWILVVVAVAVTSVSAQSPTGDALRIYLIDVEGGNATLFVSPSGEALLIDTGNGGASADRDVGRIMAAVADAGLQQIDHLITTHWHGDHFGGMTELAKRIPIGHFIDHGLNVQANPRPMPSLVARTVTCIARLGTPWFNPETGCRWLVSR